MSAHLRAHFPLPLFALRPLSLASTSQLHNTPQVRFAPTAKEGPSDITQKNPELKNKVGTIVAVPQYPSTWLTVRVDEFERNIKVCVCVCGCVCSCVGVCVWVCVCVGGCELGCKETAAFSLTCFSFLLSSSLISRHTWVTHCFGGNAYIRSAVMRCSRPASWATGCNVLGKQPAPDSPPSLVRFVCKNICTHPEVQAYAISTALLARVTSWPALS